MQDETFHFQPTLNVIIGANNSGKTAVIDALRIVLNLGSFQEKEDMIRLRPSDICLSAEPGNTAAIVFDATFCGRDTEDIAAQFLEMDVNEEAGPGFCLYQLRYQVQFRRDPVTGQYRYQSSQVTGGTHFQNPVSYDTLDYIKSIYLAPLRDVVNDGNRLGREIERLLLRHGNVNDLKAIPAELRAKTQELISAATEDKHEEAAGKSLARYASMYGVPQNSLRFMPSGLSEDMLRTLQIVFNHAHHGPEKLGLASNGLGINNLIYASVVLSRNDETTDQENKRFVLIEEPEAHLHPQSQESFFHEMNEIATHQIFVTSHSPTITAKCDIEKIIVMGHPCENEYRRPCHLAHILDDKEEDKRYLHKFLDVTRSQLLFAKGAIFVEGVTEAMLLQAFSEILGYSLRASGIEIVPLGSNGGFSHFATILGAEGLQMPCAFLTDGDERPDDLSTDAAGLVAASLDISLEADSNVHIYRGLGTFEFEMLLAATSDGRDKMRAVLKDAMKKARASSADVNDAFAADFMDFGNPAMSYRKMKQKTKDTTLLPDADWKGTARTNGEFVKGKSEFAYHLLAGIGTLLPEECAIPPYISAAIQYLIGACEVHATQEDILASTEQAVPAT